MQGYKKETIKVNLAMRPMANNCNLRIYVVMVVLKDSTLSFFLKKEKKNFSYVTHIFYGF